MWNSVRVVARTRGETSAAFVVRALARELTRCEAEMESWPISRRIEAQDRLEPEVLKLLSDAERKEWGL